MYGLSKRPATRSWTTIVRVHSDVLQREKLPPEFLTKSIWKDRFEDINAFERYLARNGILVLKFFLHLSKKEQKARFLSRLEDSKKNWKFSMADVKERGYWKQYQNAYEEVVQNTATKYAPWYVVPADNKWFARVVVASAIVNTLNKLNLSFPDVAKSTRKELEKIREALEQEDA
jgi:polyphosphate kinase 2 (PPK2 family)